MDLQLAGKVALVTGAGSGIGRAIALALAGEGAHLVLADRDLPGCEETLAQARAAVPGLRGLARQADVTRMADHQALVDAAITEFGALDVACNNAGIAGELLPVAELGEAQWRQVLDVNLTGVFLGMHCQIPRMAGRGGSIVNIGSILSQVGWATAAAYVASKHGVLGLSRTAAIEYAKQDVRINVIGPGFIRTPMIGDDPARLAQLATLHPMGRLGEPAEVADLVAYLASPRARLVNGAYFAADGGFLAQ
jgi:NAD(P)-dependent dehydrogenase (short-subunit alcohol dehydrogenase family)